MSAGDWKEMLDASHNGNIELVKYHLDQGTNPNYQHPELLTTPLIVSIESGHHNITELLLKNGANPELKAGFSTDSPLKVAKRHKNQPAIRLLKQHKKNFISSLFNRK